LQHQPHVLMGDPDRRRTDMKRVTIALGAVAVAALAAGCGNKTTPAAPSNTVVFTVNLLPSNEVPPITNAENVARGTAVITVHKDTNTIDFAVSLNSFPAGSSLTVAHIHGPNAPAGVGGGVFIGTGLSAGNAPALTNGSATFTFNGVTPPQGPDQITQI